MKVYMTSNDSAEKKIRKEGKKVTARIVECETADDPDDSEHMIFTIGFEYDVNGETVKKDLSFSLNIVHLEYANSGGLLGVPKFTCTPDDFKKALSPGEAMDVTALETPPYDFITTFNKTSVAVMKYQPMWM